MAVTTYATATKATRSSAPGTERPPRTGHAPRQFTLFPKLPAELRLAIWRCTFPGPRIVALRPRQTTVFSRTPAAAPQYVTWCTSPARPPAALHACREARVECLATYPVLFGTGGPTPPVGDPDETNADPAAAAAAAAALGGIAFSPARDVLYLTGTGAAARLRIQKLLGGAAKAGELARVRRVAIDAAALWCGGRGPGLAVAAAAACLALLAAAMPALDHIAIVRRGPGRLDGADAALVAPGAEDDVLLRNMYAALGLLRDDFAGPFPAWEIMDVAVPPPNPPQSPDEATGTVFTPPEEEDDDDEDEGW